ncbi:UDP-3-O-acyl-N-acetylglucosamine deacetylase [Roseomonas sp. JC162]|uniref:UDP-3-O-acyl-N-acetylglucosamine deacetylase n=1 Tax=Neoroseomonas marina TaxID=1232220 RepID=A0A848EKS7_9PROT|nr:UDP-3-O-acyl-N-acetylglucosamine deacetylase [Neoroseomonas marina]NMJ44369.1 UDP-3-O-acyl-N-acetylglucosamine deacetylase [Neoroseomonas marina]
MDGFLPAEAGRRRTLKAPIGCVGIGLHSGRRVSMTLRPAAAGTGIVFRRTDLGVDIPAIFDEVTDTRLCTAIGEGAARIGTIEHVMAALAGTGIDDAIVEVDAAELPIMDGSAAPFVFLIDCAGIVTTAAPRAVIEVLRPIRVEDANGAFAELLPSREAAFDAELEIDFPNTAIGRQAFALRLSPHAFREALADARTFTLAEDIARLRAAGLAQGGSLANAVVVDGPLVLNPAGLRRPDEFVRHKLLDVVGDLALAGAPIRGRFRGARSGHALNNRLLRALFADASAWRYAGIPVLAESGATVPMRAAAAPAIA